MNTFNVTPSKIETRIKSMSQFREFLEVKLGKYLPTERVFNTYFVFQFLRGEKDCLPLSSKGFSNLRQIKNCEEFDRLGLLKLINNREDMRIFIPDNLNPKRVERNTLLSVSVF